jgi:hypothetical protein
MSRVAVIFDDCNAIRLLRWIVMLAGAAWILLGVVDLVVAKEVSKRKAIPHVQVKYDPEVLNDYEKRFGSSKIGARYLEKVKNPTLVDTTVGKAAAVKPQPFEFPVLPTEVGGHPYKPKMHWGRQKTLSELIR